MNARLEWVQRNRGRPWGWKPAGAVLTALAGRLTREADTPAAAVAEALAREADEDFCRHCRIDSGGGLVVIHVDNPTLVSVMRGRWEGLLQRTLAPVLRRIRVRGITFRYGTTGIPVRCDS